MKKLEDKLQHSCVLWFSQEHLEMKGQLFAINNTANSPKQALHLKSLGVVPGVADLLFIRPSGKLVAIEMKYPDSIHNLDHVRRQAKWGAIVVKLGGESYFCTSLEQFKLIIEDDIDKNILTCFDVLDICKKSKIKTIKF